MSRTTLAALGFLVAIGTLAVVIALRGNGGDEPPRRGPPEADLAGKASQPAPRDDSFAEILSQYAGSETCGECHQAEYQRWETSHHRLAERPIELERDAVAFDPPREIRHGTQTSTARLVDGRPVVETLGGEGVKKAYPVERVFGVSPLYQFLVPVEGGRYQATELAWDPARAEWFNVYGDEDRRPGEWGHWSGRGMTWNSMCGGCHNTRLLKRYDEHTDTYDTRVAEMGVGCEACHGPLREHVEWQRAHPGERNDPGLFRLATGHILPMCGSCHSRRQELTGQFNPGDEYLEHFSPVIPDERDTYYPDGQVREEDFEFVSFLGSRMHNEGVRCINCHDPHSAKTKFEGNALCLQCHKGKIDPGPHSHHEPGTPGGNCVDCHMPLTTYMQRHPRRDHGFTIPDPLMTREHGIPNACNRCHTDRSVDWAIEAVDRWYGPRMERHTRARTRVIADARSGSADALERLLMIVREEKHFFWRAVMGGLLKLWPEDPRTHAVLVELTRDEKPLVRGMAAQALDSVVNLAIDRGREVEAAVRRLLDDPVRMVRVAAAWTLRRTVDPGSRAGSDLWTMLKHNADQPAGAMQLGVFNLERGFPRAALPYFARAVQWDANSAPLREAYAVCLSMVGEPREAAYQLSEAVRLAPLDPVNHYKLGLALNEIGRLDRALERFEEATRLAPDFARAWYNLALGRHRLGDLEKALDAIQQAEKHDPSSPDPPYVRAIILKDLGRLPEARRAARAALEIRPEYTPAEQLLELLDL